jgi:nucleoid-associated protein YgaU
MRTAVVLAATAAGVVLTAGAAAADTPTPGPAGEAWTVTDVRPDSPDTTLAPSAAPAAAGPAAAWTTTIPTPVGDQAGEQQMRRAPVKLPPPRRRPISRTGHRRATSCQTVRDGVWTVRPGDTLWQISICTHRDLADLAQVNDLPLGGRLIFPGDRITVRPPAQ